MEGGNHRTTYFLGFNSPPDELADIDASEIAEEHVIAFLSGRASLLRGVLIDQLQLERIEDESLLERRPGSVCELRLRGERLLVLLADRHLEMPGWLQAAMDRIASSTSIAADLADLVPDRASRLILARRLVREGLLRTMHGPLGSNGRSEIAHEAVPPELTLAPDAPTV